MRLGSAHSLYAAVSNDQGRTWAPPADRRPGCYYETWPARPIAVYGILPTVLTLLDEKIYYRWERDEQFRLRDQPLVFQY